MTLSIFASEERQHSPSVFQLASASKTGRVVDFCYLSNKFFPTPDLLGQLQVGFEELVRNYPSMQVEQSQLAARLTGFPERQILVGNGASELIHLVAARMGSRWLMPFPSYMEYENVLRDFGKELHFLQLREEDGFRVKIPRLLELIRQQAVDAWVLPNPNSPTGQCLELGTLLDLLEQCRDLQAVVIDESFIEFTSIDRDKIPTLRNYLDRFPNLIIVRSLGKDFGVCGLRLGVVATANVSFLDEVRRFLPIWNISPLAERFLRLCEGHMAQYEQARRACIEETQSLARRLAALPELQVFETFSNFILFKILKEGVSSEELRDHLLREYGFYVRDCSRKQGLGDRFIRVGTNLPAENTQLVEGIRAFLRNRSAA